MISVFHHKVDENCAHLGYYTVSSVDFLPMFLGTVSVRSSGVKILTPEDGTNYSLRNIPEEHSSQNSKMFLHMLRRIYFVQYAAFFQVHLLKVLLISFIADIIFILLITMAVKKPCEHVADSRYLGTRIMVELVYMRKFGRD